MPEKFKEVTPPRCGKTGLGGLLGHRFLLLTHTGRKSGMPRQTVLEVVRYDGKTPAFVVAAGFGRTSDWYLNIRKQPKVTLQCGRKSWQMNSRFLTPDESGVELVDYSRRHPLAMRELSQFMGYKLNGTEDDVRELGKLLPMVYFQPV